MIGRLFALLLLCLLCGCAAERSEVTSASTGSAYLGPDVLWRPREWLTFNLLDNRGGGMTLTFTVRDMNTYVAAPSPVMFQVVGPHGKVLAREMLEDDGITGGNEKYQEGIYDPFADFRYRQYHRANSPGGLPPGKARSPYLDHPEKLPFRTVTVKVPDAGKGLYRVSVCGRWDHWISLTPNRPMAAGIHPGAGPLYVHGKVLNQSYFYVPPQTHDVGLSVTEEVPPYQASLALFDPQGKPIRAVKASGFCTWFYFTPPVKGAVYRLDLNSSSTGVCLHSRGIPMVLCPDAATAAAIHGGMETDTKGRATCFEPVAILNRWADTLRPADLAVKVKLTPAQEKAVMTLKIDMSDFKVTGKQVMELIDNQNVDPSSPAFGSFTAKPKGGDPADLLALAAGYKVADNPFYGNPALIRRVLLARLNELRKLDSSCRFDDSEWPRSKPAAIGSFFDLPTRSNWYGLGLDVDHCMSLLLMKDAAPAVLPPEVLTAWKDIYRLWAGSRWNMQVGEVANQWGWNMRELNRIRKVTGDADMAPMIRRHIATVTAPGLFGRLNPDRTPFDGSGKRDVDCGLTPSGYMPEQLGFDGEYTCEQTLLWGWIWREFSDQGIVDWFDKFNYLKTHLTVPVGSGVPKFCFNGTCSPTDLNFRTRYMTHKNHQPPEMAGQVRYLDLWFPKSGVESAQPWPCLDKAPFIRSVGNKYFFIRQGDYYAVVYAGPRAPLWSSWSAYSLNGDSANMDGFDGSGYGAWGMKANKPGGLSALWVAGCGPVILGQNHTIGDTDNVWGRTAKPLYQAWRHEDVDPTEFASCYAQPEAAFDVATATYRLKETIPFTPLTVERTYRFTATGVKLAVSIIAVSDFTAQELYYSLPLFADKRQLAIIGTDGHSTPVKLPASVTTPQRPRYPDAKLEKQRNNVVPFQAKTLTLTAANGAGIRIVLDREFTCRPLQPFRYRKEMPAAGGVLLSLPLTFRAGETVKFGYELEVIAAKNVN